MGWTYRSQCPQVTVTEVMRNDVYGEAVIDGEVARGVWYGVWRYNGRKIAVIALLDNFYGEGKTAECGLHFGYKEMDESMGPYCYDMPKTLYDQLDPLPDGEEWKYARRWRREVEKRIAEKNRQLELFHA